MAYGVICGAVIPVTTQSAASQVEFLLNPALDHQAIAAGLARDGFVQIEGALVPEAAEILWSALRHQTPWGLAWAGDGQPHGRYERADQLQALPPASKAAIGNAAASAASQGRFAFLYGRYPVVEAYREQWHPGHPLYGLLEALNAPEWLDFARTVSGRKDILRADAQATLYAGGHFLTEHDDLVESEGRQLAYVLHMARDWKPDWGGYLNILDAEGDIRHGCMPRFNSLTLFTVPLRHHVSVVAAFAPLGRFAVTGWFRNR